MPQSGHHRSILVTMAVWWAERHLDAEDYEGIFGAVSEDGESDDAIVTLRLSAAVSKALGREMAKTGRTKREIVNDILDRALL